MVHVLRIWENDFTAFLAVGTQEVPTAMVEITYLVQFNGIWKIEFHPAKAADIARHSGCLEWFVSSIK